tara:strand:+ start:441 stop:1100 length:660 start_codon:yes stop_codon:yes gene_type:complete
MAITVSNFFDYYSTLSKKKRLDSREARVRSREMSISRSVPAAPAPVVDDESKFIEAQNFFGMGFREGMRKGQLGEEFNPNELGNMFKFYFGSGLKRREYGGPVLKGESYLVGEDGPEVYTASNDGKIIPNNLLSPNMSGLDGGGSVTDAVMTPADKISDAISIYNTNMEKTNTRTIVQPSVVNNTIPVPQPIMMPTTGKTTVETMSRSKFNNIMAKGIK